MSPYLCFVSDFEWSCNLNFPSRVQSNLNLNFEIKISCQFIFMIVSVEQNLACAVSLRAGLRTGPPLQKFQACSKPNADPQWDWENLDRFRIWNTLRTPPEKEVLFFSGVKFLEICRISANCGRFWCVSRNVEEVREIPRDVYQDRREKQRIG